ncbi:cytochrome c oxidase biogenesis protein Cmc1 like-domain-containing protein [Phyllosticta citriasiana]|uniref:COX assembly mitochondrial protein n=1 Tax=Phyllosticta citriasiana TaxID=595635 RepID=A0ABR1KTN2_9PEZI
MAASAAATGGSGSNSGPAGPTVTIDRDSIPRDPVPTRPIPLKASQEAQVKELYYARVRQKCADEIREFATCASNRTFTATFACRAQRLAMNSCMVGYATQEELDRAREEWWATRSLRKAEREAKERKRVEQEKFHREWWGLDENGRRKLADKKAKE